MANQLFDKSLFERPFTCIISGPTSSSKTLFTYRFTTHIDNLVVPKIQEIIFCFSIMQHEYIKIENNVRDKFLKGFPDIENLQSGVRRLVVVDDMISELNTDNAYMRQSSLYL